MMKFLAINALISSTAFADVGHVVGQHSAVDALEHSALEETSTERDLLFTQAQKETALWGCGDNVHDSPLQVICTNNAGCDMKALTITTGEYEQLFHVKQQLSNQDYTRINACAVNPKDDILYCTMGYGDGKQEKGYLIRMAPGDTVQDSDPTGGYAFVGHIPSWWHSGTFDHEGVYYGTGGQNIYMIPGLKDMAGYSTPEASADFKDADSFRAGEKGHDLVAIHGNFDRSGEKTYLVWLTKKNKVGVARVPTDTDAAEVWFLATDVPVAGASWGAGWNYENTIYFSMNDGKGVYQIETDSFDLKAKTATVTKVGESAETNKNDGANCMDVASPWSTSTTTTNQPATTTKQPATTTTTTEVATTTRTPNPATCPTEDFLREADEAGSCANRCHTGFRCCPSSSRCVPEGTPCDTPPETCKQTCGVGWACCPAQGNQCIKHPIHNYKALCECTETDKCHTGFIRKPACEECGGLVVCQRCKVAKHCSGVGTVTSNSAGTECICSAGASVQVDSGRGFTPMP